MVFLARKNNFHARRASHPRKFPQKEKPIYLTLAALAVLVVVGGIFISPNFGGPTGALNLDNGIVLDGSPPTTSPFLSVVSLTKTSVTLGNSGSCSDAQSGCTSTIKLYYNSNRDPQNYWILYTGTPMNDIRPYRVLGLAPGTVYNFKASFLDNWGNEGNNSTVLQVTTKQLTPPSAPANLNAANSTTNGVHVVLLWTASTDDGGDGGVGIKNYNIYRNQTLVGSTAATTYSDADVSLGKTYFYIVKAVNNVGLLESAASNEKRITTPNLPTSPRSLAATAGIGKIDLNWSAPASNGGDAIQCYKIYRETSASGQFANPIGGTDSDCLNSPAGTNYADTGLVAGATYYYKIVARNGVGISSQTEVASARVPASPDAISDLTAAPRTKKIDLAWTAPSNGGSPILCFKVYRRWLEGQSENYVLVSSNNQNSCEITDLTEIKYTDSTVSEKQTYSYIVKALNSAGLAAASNMAVARVPDTTPPTVLSASLTNQTKNLRTDLPYIILNFSEPISASSITASTITISPEVQHTRTIEPSGKDVKVSLNENLSYGKTYTLAAGTGIKDLENNSLLSDYKISFTTVVDATTLIILESSMQNNSVNVSAVLPEVSITFNKEINAATDSAITISPSVNFTKQWSHDKKTISFSLSNSLTYDTNYKLTVAKTLKDIYGFRLPEDYSVVFITEPATAVELASIENNTADVPVDVGNLTITFSRSIDSSTDSAITIFPKLDINKEWSEDGKTATISFSKDLNYKTDYKLAVSTGLKDYNGINLAKPYRLSFRTASPTTTSTQLSATTTTPTQEITTTTSAKPGGISASEALAAIQAANLAIQTSEGKKDVSAAKTLYAQASAEYSKSNYSGAKTLALQAKTSIKDLAPKEEFPILYISIAAAILLLLATGGIYIYLKKNQAKATEKKPEAPPTPPPSQARR